VTYQHQNADAIIQLFFVAVNFCKKNCASFCARSSQRPHHPPRRFLCGAVFAEAQAQVLVAFAELAGVVVFEP